MQSPAAIFGWEFRTRHRWGLIAIVAALLILGTIRVVLLSTEGRVDFKSSQTFAAMVIVPLAAAFFYALAVFTFGLAGDIAARESIYPRRMFTLPVTADALAGWPMAYGCATMIVLWIAMRALGVWPSDVHVPIVWPALLGASLLAWTQAFTWLSYPLRGMRVIVAMLWLTTFDAIVMIGLELRVPEGVMVMFLAPHVPLAYLVARYAVRRARSGDVPDWGHLFAERRRAADSTSRFSSAARAQMWFEWRQHGRSLPVLVALLVPIELLLLFPFREVPVIVTEMLVLALITPPFMAVFVAATVSKSNTSSDSYGMTPFLATRPLDNAAIISAKLKAASLSTLASWLVLLIMIPLGVHLSDTSYVVVEKAEWMVNVFGRPRAIAIGVLVVVALVAATWKQLVQSLCIGMSGREWLVKGSVFGPLAILTLLFPATLWVLDEGGRIAVVWRLLPLLITIAVCVKLAVAAWVLRRLDARGILSRRKLLAAVVTWDVLVFALYGVFAWIIPWLLIRRSIFMMIAILAVPLVRLAAAPLAVNTNRHR